MTYKINFGFPDFRHRCIDEVYLPFFMYINHVVEVVLPYKKIPGKVLTH